MACDFYVGIIGSRDCKKELAEIAYQTGRLIALERWILVCGGMGGIMEYACRGASENNGVTMGILPVNSRKDGNSYLTYSVVTGLGEARNSIVVKSCDAIIAVSGGYGTLSEIAFANLYNIPVISIRSWEKGFTGDKEIKLADHYAESPEAAVKYIKNLL